MRAAQRLSPGVQAGVPTESYQGEPRSAWFQGGPVTEGLRAGSPEWSEVVSVRPPLRGTANLIVKGAVVTGALGVRSNRLERRGGGAGGQRQPVPGGIPNGFRRGVVGRCVELRGWCVSMLVIEVGLPHFDIGGESLGHLLRVVLAA